MNLVTADFLRSLEQKHRVVFSADLRDLLLATRTDAPDVKTIPYLAHILRHVWRIPCDFFGLPLHKEPMLKPDEELKQFDTAAYHEGSGTLADCLKYAADLAAGSGEPGAVEGGGDTLHGPVTGKHVVAAIAEFHPEVLLRCLYPSSRVRELIEHWRSNISFRRGPVRKALFRDANALDGYLVKRGRFRGGKIQLVPQDWQPKWICFELYTRGQEYNYVNFSLSGVVISPPIPSSRAHRLVLVVVSISAAVAENSGNILHIETAGSVRVPDLPAHLHVTFEHASIIERRAGGQDIGEKASGK